MAVASISRRLHHTRSYFQTPPAPLPTVTPEPEKSLCGLLADRAGAKRTLAACLAPQAVAIALYLLGRDLEILDAVSMLLGFSYGGAMSQYAILEREYFPAKIMGSVFS